MGGINWSVLHQPAPPSALQQGSSMLSDALDAVLQRRHQQQLKQEEIAAENERARLRAQAEAEQNRVKNEFDQQKIANDVATQKANQTNMEAQRLHDQAKLANDAYERAAPELAAGNIAAVTPGLRAAGVGVRGPDQRRASGVPVAPPPQAPPMAIDPADVAFAPPGAFDNVQSTQPPPVSGVSPEEAETNAFLDKLGESVDPTAPAGAYSFDMPGQTSPTYFDPAQVEAERRAEGKKVRGSFAQSAKEPYEVEALNNTEAAIASGTIKRTEAAKYYTDQVKAARDRMERANRPRGKGGGNDRFKAADDARADNNAFRVAYNDWEKESGVNVLTSSLNQIKKSESAVSSYRKNGDTIGVKDALYSTARAITGVGVLTQQEYDNTVRNTAGLSQAILTKIFNKTSGEISDGEAQALERYITAVKAAIKEKAKDQLGNYKVRFEDPESYEFTTAGKQVGVAKRALMQRFDLKPGELASQGPDPKTISDSLARARAAAKGSAP